ncbi:MAG TPA: hypothetical protein VHE35_37305 [Kofleriaceae bacterium]|nr:hypothetical protein [Kofleriaceae bacterium]
MRAIVPRILPVSDLPPAPAVRAARWTHAFQRTADPRAAAGDAAQGRLALEDFVVSAAAADGELLAGDRRLPAGQSELVAVARVPARAALVTVAVDVTIEALVAKLVVRAGLGRARLALELAVASAGGDELARVAVELVDLAATGPDAAAWPATALVRAPMACTFARAAGEPRDLHVALRARWDVDCGACGQFLLRGRAHTAPPAITLAPREPAAPRLALTR